MKQVIVLGSTGFIGSRLMLELQRDSSMQVKGYGSKDCDLCDTTSIEQNLKLNRDTCIVFCSGIRRDKDKSPEAAKKNTLMLQNLINAIPDEGLQSFIFISSTSVFGGKPHSLPICEKTPKNPSDDYARSKLQSEETIEGWRVDFPKMILRPSIVYGSGDKGQSLIGRWCKEIRQGGVVPVIGEGRDKRDFLEISDLTQVIVHFVRCPVSENVNIASGQSHTMIQAIEWLFETMNKPCSIEKNARSSDQEYEVSFDISHLKKIIPTFIPLGFEIGIRRYAIQN